MTALHMPAVVSVSSHDKVKMDDRKRSLAVADGDDIAPRAKRLVKDENGQAMRMDAEKEKDVEQYQKDAILRQMKEWKRKNRDLEAEYNDLLKRTKSHDERVRVIDAWWAQLLDTIRTIAGETLPPPPSTASGEDSYGSALLFEESDLFSQHLQDKADNIKAVLSDLFGRLSQSISPDAAELQRQINTLLAREKEHGVQLRMALEDKESLNGKWEAAVERYMTAEKKLDRAKSQQVLKLERQALTGGSGEVASSAVSKKAEPPVKSEHPEVNGVENGVGSAEAEAAKHEALAIAERQKAQVAEVEGENERLTNELSAARTKLASLTDDDYAETALFKSLKSQFEDVVKRINDLEAVHIQLREETQKYAAERTAYRRTIDEENRDNIGESEAQIARAETDLARIRAQRDELSAELEIRKKAEEVRRTSADQARELAEARDSKISSLESEIERLKLKLGESTPPQPSSDDDADADILRTRLHSLESQHDLLKRELGSMEAAWLKASALANAKVTDAASQEELVSRLQQEKAKADQKYFAAMKAKDMKEGELRALRSQNQRSSEIVTQLKDSEGKTKELVANLERQLAESREGLMKMEKEYRAVEQKAKEAGIKSEGLGKQVEELKTLIAGKDKDNLALAKAKREADVELEKLQARLEDTKKQVEALRKSRAAENSASSDEWRKIVICPVCNSNLRNTVLKLCGHVFCQNCVKDLIANRSRKCPSCGKAFGNSDHMGIVLT